MAGHTLRSAGSAGSAWTLNLFCGAVFLFLFVPSLIVIPMAFSDSPFLRFPPEGFSFRWFDEYFNDKRWLSATVRSVRIAAATTLLAMIIGTMAAMALARRKGALKSTLVVFILSPLILPVIVFAVAAYSLYASIGIVGSDFGLIVAHTILAVPFVFLTVTASLFRYDTSLSRAAASSGANPWVTFWLITLPLIKPGIITGALFAFITSFDEIVVAVFMSGIESTLPKKMFDEVRFELKPVLAAVATLLILVTTFTLLLVSQVGTRSGSPKRAER